MINRYSRPEMANIWTEENKYKAWLEVEILADEAWAELGEIPKEDVALIREKAFLEVYHMSRQLRSLATNFVQKLLTMVILPKNSSSDFS